MTQTEQIHSPEQEQKPLQSLIAVTSVPAKLTVNFEALREALQREVARYDVVVTADSVSEARKLAAELNATAKEIDRRRKEEVAKASEPVRAFDERMRELVAMCTDGRKRITDQIERFDIETRLIAERLLHEARAEFWKELGVKPEFYRAEFDDLVMVSAVTKAGSLAGKQKTILQNRCRDDRVMQDRTERRLLELENASLRAGLKEARQKAEAEQRERQRQEREARAREEARQRYERNEAERRARGQRDGNPGAPVKQILGGLPRDTQWETPPAEEILTDEEEREMLAAKMDAAAAFGEEIAAPAPGSRRIRVVAQFEVDAPPGLSDDEIVTECRRVMAAAGITTLTDVYVVQGAVSGGQMVRGAA